MNYVYEVFTRIKRGDMLAHIGSVEAPTDELAMVYAIFTYDEEDWAEMSVARRDNIHSAMPLEGLFVKEGALRHE